MVIFLVGSHFMPRLSWTTILLFVLLHVPGMAGAHHHTQPLVEIGSQELFTRASHKLRLSLTPLPK
jgi:hypothetical protein